MGQSAQGSRRDAMWGLLLSSLIIGLAVGDVNFGSHHHNQEARGGRQEGGVVPGGIDFSGCEEDPDTGLCCIDKEESVTTIKKDPILECTHKNTEQCHYTYVTQFTPTQEEVSEEVLHTDREGVQRSGSRGLPNCVRVVLHNQVCGEAARQVCRRHRL